MFFNSSSESISALLWYPNFTAYLFFPGRYENRQRQTWQKKMDTYCGGFWVPNVNFLYISKNWSFWKPNLHTQKNLNCSAQKSFCFFLNVLSIFPDLFRNLYQYSFRSYKKNTKMLCPILCFNWQGKEMQYSRL